MAQHIRAVASLGQAVPVRLVLDGTNPAQPVGCTVISSDFPHAFALITGVLGAQGFSIQSGEAFTYAAGQLSATPPLDERAPVGGGR